MDSNRKRWQPAFRFTAWVALAYLGLVGGAIAISKILSRVVPCQPAADIKLACPLLGIDFYTARLYAGVVAWYGLFALPVVLLVIVIAVLIGVCGWLSARRGARAS